MSLLPRLARPQGRAFSSFFSSKPGGGRHFVSAKPPKPVLQPGRAKLDNPAPTTDPAASPSPDAVAAKPAAADEKPSNKPAETRPQSSPSPPPFSRSSPFSSSGHVPPHPTVSAKEYKLHQFFALHRPLLLLNQPTSAVFDTADPSTPWLTPSEDHPSLATIDNPPESSPDADADAARQLAHTLVMSRVGGAIAWQQSLSRLGLSSVCSENDMTLAKESAQEWVSIHADSTRRKRRKKMKKHKLKKRRRLTRRQNK